MNKKSISYTLATEADEPALRQILKDNPMHGTISLSFEREPYFFNASQIEGNNHITLLSRNLENQIVGMGSRSSRLYWVDGKLTNIGYMSQLRLLNEFRTSPHRITHAYEKLYEVHRQINDVQFYLVTVLEDNNRARRFLTSGKKKIPIHKEWNRLNTFILPLTYKRVNSEDYLIHKASYTDKALIIELLQSNYKNKSLAPYWDEKTLFDPSTKLRPESFFIATHKKSSTPVACVAVWDQSSFKQVYIQNYEKKMQYFRPILNLFRRWTKYPYFPKVGSQFSHAFLSHLAIDDGHDESLVPLVQTAINQNINQGFHYLSLGLLQNSQLIPIIQKEFRPYTLKSIAYLAYWPGDENPVDHWPDVNGHLEIAVL
jgi:hypothetical protein